MGLVTSQLIKMLQKQVKHHGTVVWFDPENQYTHVAQNLTLQDTKVFLYDPAEGYLSLRRAIEHFWVGETPPSLVIYVPKALQDIDQALIEYTTAGVIMRPGQQPPECNTRLPVITRSALEEVCPPMVLDQYIADAEAGKLNLFELDDLAENCSEGQIGSLSLIFDSGNPEDIALSFLAGSQHDQAILDKNAAGDLAYLFTNTFGIDFSAYQADLQALRAQLSRFILGNELRETVRGDLPEILIDFPEPEKKTNRESALRVGQQWRQRTDLAESYIATSEKVEVEFALGNIAWSVENLQICHTFPRLETQLQTFLEESLIEDPEDETIEIVNTRREGFWATHKPEIKLRWEIIAHAGNVLMGSKQLKTALKSNKHSATKLLENYTTADEPWFKLDTNFRYLDRDFHYFDLEETIHDSLVRLVAKARNEYNQAIDQLATKFLHAFEATGFELPGVLHQVEIFHDFVDPSTQEGPTAYFLVDALRFEMARELQEQFIEEWDTVINSALATPPAITEIGMAALMPGAEKGLTIVSAGASKLAAIVTGETLKNRADRVKLLQNQDNLSVEVVRLDQIAPLKTKKLRNNLKNAQLIVVTATDEIDRFWESNPHMARRMQDDVFSQLQRGIRVLFGIGVKRVIISADHGYLAGDQLLPGQGIDSPGGQTTDLHRRVWIGKGGMQIPGTLRKPLSAFGLGGDFELVTPYNLACFKTPGGSTEYFHGGLSLQELVVPVLVVTPGKEPMFDQERIFAWEIKPGSQKITSLFFSVNIGGVSQALFQEAPSVRVELREGSKIISQPVSSSYGFNPVTRDVVLEFDPTETSKMTENTITLHIIDKPASQSVKLFVLDAETGISFVKPLDIDVDLLV